MTAPTSPGWPEAIVAQIVAEHAVSGMSVNELAERVGIHPGSWPRYAKGQRQMTLELVEKFALALGIDMPTLFRRAQERQSQG